MWGERSSKERKCWGSRFRTQIQLSNPVRIFTHAPHNMQQGEATPSSSSSSTPSSSSSSPAPSSSSSRKEAGTVVSGESTKQGIQLVCNNPEDVGEVPDGFQYFSEGSANILYADINEVFYNPVQEFNRDLSILMIKMHQEVLKDEGMWYLSAPPPHSTSYTHVPTHVHAPLTLTLHHVHTLLVAH